MRKPKNRGVAYEDVRAVVDMMLAKGADINDISLRDLRDELGTGSFSTLAKHLDACKDDIIFASKGADALMEQHVAAVAAMMGDIVARATFEINRTAEMEVTAARAEAHRSQRELSEAREIANELEADLEKVRADLSDAQAVGSGKDETIARLEGKVEGLELTLDKLTLDKLKPHSAVADVRTTVIDSTSVGPIEPTQEPLVDRSGAPPSVEIALAAATVPLDSDAVEDGAMNAGAVPIEAGDPAPESEAIATDPTVGRAG